MSIAFGILVILIGSIIKRYDVEKIDILFWSGVFFALGIIGAIVVIVFKISNKTKEIKDL